MPTSIGLIGCGDWGRHILRDLNTLGCAVTVVARSARSRANASAGGAAAIVSDIADLPEVAGVVVASTTISHAEVIGALLGRGVPIFCEKPLTADAAEARRLARLAPGRLFVMDKWRYHPGVQLLAQLARSGELGPVLGLRTLRLQWGNPHADTDVIWHLLPHDLAIALEILGTLPPARAAAIERLDATPVSMVALLGADPWLAVEVSSRSVERRREVRLHCRDGLAILRDGYSETVSVYRSATDRERSLPPADERPIPGELPLLAELRAFVAHLRGGPPPRSSAADGALIVERIAELRALG